MKGGYQIIDLNGTALSGTNKGLLDKINNANGKPIILTNFKISTTLYPLMNSVSYVSDGDSGYILTLVMSNTLYKIAISKAGAITVTSGNVTVS